MNLAKTTIKTPLVPIEFLLPENPAESIACQIFIKREDLNHSEISGNKWHKLKHNLIRAKQLNCNQLLTFGGAFSNHIAATAAAGKEMAMPSIGIIRGDELANAPQKWSPTLLAAHKNGMRFEFVSRQTYRRREQPDYQQSLLAKYPNSYLIPEGGSNELALLGFKELMTDINQQCPDWTHLYCAVGTGATLAGIIRYANAGLDKPRARQIFGIAVLKQATYLLAPIHHWLSCSLPNMDKTSEQNDELVHWQLLTQYHGGGYGKQSDVDAQQQLAFEKQHNIPLDPVYTAKVIKAVQQEFAQNRIPPKSKVIILHSGGLQGRNPDINLKL
ncbi:1-aminocyclopropane-1-carboxylate deaminase/D-cysteine desulfhydrase [Thiomicrorhabdus sediminis]|uniref:Pyridoxal-phosphate dependent enzyme n=1 Tax=Thiomicrorhabdus sediminis TaxID=2580412 RepID=A0A4P9K5S5_9GAMM|nr:pyridoxal-phosphate dependent enzyme [Thiomicrorhabdus sediminis]QCU90355.1 pyridoxal-phosphate dependent enzyme [Thiomicrorhabdus sediminis]